jgi:hypothetical protein
MKIVYKYLTLVLIQNQQKYVKRFFALFFIMGLVNNLGYLFLYNQSYWLILVGSADLSNKLGNKNLMGLYLLTLIVCASLARFINSKYLIKTSYKARLLFLTFYFLLGYISLFVILYFMESNENKEIGFYLSLIPSLIMGTGQAFGESIVLGYLRNFPKGLVSGWGSGTGLAGLSGATITLLFKIFEIKSQILYISVAPICLLYYVAFMLIEKFRNE